MDACEEVAAALETKICKNLFLCNRQKTSFYLLLMPGDKPFHTKEITSQLGCARLSFAREEALEQLLHLTPGSATIFGLMYDTETRCSWWWIRNCSGSRTSAVIPASTLPPSGCRPAMSLTS